MLEPRPYQTEAVTACLEAAAAGQRRVLVALPTGTGKTIIFAKLLHERGGRSLVLAHRDELIQQAADKLRLVDDTRRIGIVKADRDETTAPTVVASVQTLARPRRLERLTPDFTTLVVDEAHHAVADSYQRILDHCGAWEPVGPLVVGVTATPERGDKQALAEVFEAIVYQKSILEMLRAGYLCDLRAVQVMVQANFSALRTTRGDWQEGDLERALLAANAPEQVLEAFQEHARDRKALCFTPTVKTAYAIAEAFQEAGIAAAALDGTTPLDERRAILHRLHTGATQVVCNCGVLTEGFDEPSIDCIIMARPTQSRVLYTQMLGRGTRTYPGKADCLILDVVGVTTSHRLQTVATLFDLAPAQLKAATVSEALEAQERETRACEETSGTLVARAIDLFARRPLAWVQTRRGAWVLGLGGEQGRLRLEMVPGQDTWRVLHEHTNGHTEVRHQALPLGYAQGAAEDLARALGAGRLLDPQAPWRHTPASDKQKEALRKWGVAFDPAITKGEAGALLTAIFGDRPPRAVAPALRQPRMIVGGRVLGGD